MEINYDPNNTMGEEMGQTANQPEAITSQADQQVEETTQGPSQEIEEARKKMSNLLDKLDDSVGDKGVIAQGVGDKDETGDHRAAILKEPHIKELGNGNREIAWVVLTPDGTMVVDGNNAASGGVALTKLVFQDITPDNYIPYRDGLRDLKYKSTAIGDITSHSLEGTVGMNRATIYLTPAERSIIKGVDVEAQFNKSMVKAGVQMEAYKAKNSQLEADAAAQQASEQAGQTVREALLLQQIKEQARKTAETATSLSSKL